MAADELFIKRINSHMAALSWFQLVSHANLKAHRKLMTGMGLNASDLSDPIFVFSLLALFVIFFAKFSSYSDDLSTKR